VESSYSNIFSSSTLFVMVKFVNRWTLRWRLRYRPASLVITNSSIQRYQCSLSIVPIHQPSQTEPCCPFVAPFTVQASYPLRLYLLLGLFHCPGQLPPPSLSSSSLFVLYCTMAPDSCNILLVTPHSEKCTPARTTYRAAYL
jgi:hypothetical protein